MANTVTAAPPVFADGFTYAGAVLRRHLLGAVFPSAGRVRGTDPGALPTPDMRVRLPAGLYLVDDGQGGYYPVECETQTDLDIAASSATFSRKDLLIAEVVDNGTADTTLYRFRILTGTPAGSPSAPALPPTDQPTGRALAVLEITVRPNAESNGKIRAEDCKVVAPWAATTPRPVRSRQIADAGNTDFGVASTWSDFSAAKWPAITFVAPRSGQVWITVSANVDQLNTTSASAWAGWRISGTGVSYDATDRQGVSAKAGRTYASKRVLVDVPPGVTVTVTPQWWVSSSGATTTITDGELDVEPVA
ncbi:MAG TPA: hypothetical protein VGL93_10570 [Streptosporangiaceae bacterium]|jgi:hypothetical protein